MAGSCEYLLSKEDVPEDAAGAPAVVFSGKRMDLPNSLCRSRMSLEPGGPNPFCDQRKPSNQCPVARYSRGEITLKEANELLG
jgi:hypothetical protein